MTKNIDHKKVWGSGYHQGLKEGNTFRRGEALRATYDATDVMLCWKPNSSDVKLVEHPDRNDETRGYRAVLACNFGMKEANFETRKARVFIEFSHLVVRDGVDPVALHNVLLDLQEYRDGCADDMLRTF